MGLDETGFDAYIICATPRSGTTLLCDMLEATGAAGRPNSYFREQDIPDWANDWGVTARKQNKARAFCEAYVAAMIGQGRAGTDVFGLRLMWGSISLALEMLSRIHPNPDGAAVLFERTFGSTLYIHVSRTDKVAQAISRLRAERSGLWHRAADGSVRESAQSLQPVVYDAAAIAAYVAEQEADDAAWKGFFATNNLTPLPLTYEALAARPQETLRSVLSALGRDPGIADSVSPRTMKLADEQSREWAERFRKEQDKTRHD